MSKLKVNDLVISLVDSTGGGSQPRKKGEIYKINAVCYCVGCGDQFVNLGARLEEEGRIVCPCTSSQGDNKMYWSIASLFVKADQESLSKIIEDLVYSEDYERAAFMRDFLKDLQ